MRPAPVELHAEAVARLLRAALADPGTAWSLGSFGAIAEFVRDPDEAVTALPDARLGLATARGAIALDVLPELRPLAYETAFASGWNHAVALCLPAGSCAMGRRTVVTELGPDTQAARAEDRDAVLFDLGLGLSAVDACVRTRDPASLACLRAGVGRPLFDHANPIGPQLVAMSPHRVFVARFGRIEVFSAIPGAGGTSPEGPHTHVLPKLLKGGRTHAATTPIPAGLVPCGAIHPPHPYKDGMGMRIPFEPARLAAFQTLLERWADPDWLAIKRGADPGPGGPISPKHAQSARRAAALQAQYLHGESVEEVPGEADEEA
ncbi:hypothetical protein ASG52_03180 [Methylobacterium sp. Leaf456]|uniref:DUF6925 family protein n=1 Tax=Methylobacterium sp. Leaf456 TaxID=1736382 RepID=UPI0006FC6105|nr:hypothetical protein [Methylobacterium sp. Leaf456]KQT57086.1 hypothetical protein ASG52_03180 [Methylobacterium sp. Leaf456]